MHGKRINFLSVWKWGSQSLFLLLKLFKVTKCAVLAFQKVWENAWDTLWQEFFPVVYSALFHKWQTHYSAGCKTIAFVNVWAADISIYCTAWALYKLNLLFFSNFFKNCFLWFYDREYKREKSHGCSVVQSREKESPNACFFQPLISAAHSIQLLMQNLILVLHFPFLNLLNMIQNGNSYFIPNAF